MTRNVDPALRAYFDTQVALDTWAKAEHDAPVIVRTADGLLRLRTDMPASRADCPTQRTAEGYRMCGHVKCRAHLWTIADDGRPWGGPRYTLRAAWLESPTPATCALDLASATRSFKQRGMTTEEMASPSALGCHPTLVRRRVKEALRTVKAKGIDVSEWQAMMDEEEEANG